MPVAMSRRNVLSLDDQGPVRSGLPSSPRGMGASRFGVPSALRGTLGVGTLIQFCASGETDVTDNATTIAAANRRPAERGKRDRAAAKGSRNDAVLGGFRRSFAAIAGSIAPWR